MLRKLPFVLLALGALTLIACGDDTKPATQKDKGGLVLPDGSVTQKDTGTNPPQDTGTNPPKDTGTVTPPAGFGDTCSQTKACTDSKMMCAVTVQGATTGFCTTECTNKGGECTGTPTGTKAFCILSDSTKTKYYCAFLCAAKDQAGTVATFPCPTALKCDTVESPAGSGQKACIP